MNLALQLAQEHPFFVLVLAAGLFYLVRMAYALRQGASWVVQAFLTAFIAMVVVRMLVDAKGISGFSAESLGAACGGIAFFLYPKRSRHIPEEVKRRVIERHRKRGGSYDPREDDIDHIVPFSRGGSHTADNLRVLNKRKNRSKGAQMPSVVDWFR